MRLADQTVDAWQARPRIQSTKAVYPARVKAISHLSLKGVAHLPYGKGNGPKVDIDLVESATAPCFGVDSMRRLIRTLLLASAALASGGAAAQTGDDCDRAPFPLRSQPQSVVDRAARADAGDLGRTVTGVIFGRCEDATTRVFVCGVTGRRTGPGTVDQQRRFFGVYDSGKFTITAVGRFAERACKEKVYR